MTRPSTTWIPFKRYALLYREFVASCIAEATTYRVNLLLLVAMDMLFYLVTISASAFLFDHVDRIGPWDRAEFLFFISFMLSVDQLHMVFISEGFWNLSHDIRTGKLDFILLKPVWTWFPIFLRMVRAGSILNFPVPWALMIYFGTQVGLAWNQWLMLPLCVLMALWTIVSIEIAVSMLMFWTIESFGINFLRMQLQQVSRWPDFIFRKPARILFTFLLPVLVVGSWPVGAIMGERSVWSFLFGCSMVISLFLGISALLWRKALRRYESASS